MLIGCIFWALYEPAVAGTWNIRVDSLLISVLLLVFRRIIGAFERRDGPSNRDVSNDNHLAVPSLFHPIRVFRGSDFSVRAVRIHGIGPVRLVLINSSTNQLINSP